MRQRNERQGCWQGTQRREERKCNNQPDKRRKSSRMRGNGAVRGRGAGRGCDGVRRGDATTCWARGAGAEEQEAMAWQEEKAAALSDLPPDGTWQREKN